MDRRNSQLYQLSSSGQPIRSPKGPRQNSHPTRGLSATGGNDHPSYFQPGRHRPEPLPLPSHQYPPAVSPGPTDYFSPRAYSDERDTPMSTSSSKYSRTYLKDEYDKDGLAAPFITTPGWSPLGYGQEQTVFDLRRKETGFRAIFEAPDWTNLGLHALACACAYPFLLLVCLIASNKTLFWCRVCVGLGCGMLGFSLGRSPYMFARKYLEASAWATFIHESTSGQNSGIQLRDLSQRTNDPMGVYTAFQLLYSRNFKTGLNRRKYYDKKPWTFAILFFMFLVGFCATVTFILGRIVIISTFTEQRHDSFDEVPIFADLSDGDIEQAGQLTDVLSSFVATWTLTPFASLTSLPKPVSFKSGNDTVYFAESYPSQLKADGTGIGTFVLDATFPNATEVDAFRIANDPSAKTSDGLVQFPKWGLRIACESMPNIQNFVVPMSAAGLTYVFVPDSIVNQLFSRLSITVPPITPANLTRVVGTDPLPFTLNDTAILAAAGFYNNGVGHSLFSRTVDMGGSGNGWVTIEVLSVRLNDTFTPSGSFALKGDPLPDATGKATRIGYDVAVCIEAYEPWIIESYNSSGLLPTSTRIVKKANQFPDSDLSLEGGQRKTKLNDVSRAINSTGKFTAFATAHDNSVNQMVKDNGRDFFYVPSPMVVSFTSGIGPSGYTTLSPERYESARASADATSVLPFLAGSKQLVARKYNDLTLANARIDNLLTIIALTIILMIGLIAGTFVPKLPLGVPRRGFDLLSWVAVLHGDNLAEQMPKGTLSEKLDLRTVDERVGGTRIRYISGRPGLT